MAVSPEHDSNERCNQCGAWSGHLRRCPTLNGGTGIETVTRQTEFYKELLAEAERKGQWNLLNEYRANGFDVTEDYRVMLKYLRDLPTRGEKTTPEPTPQDKMYLFALGVCWDKEGK